jgi:hypothetical protein
VSVIPLIAFFVQFIPYLSTTNPFEAFIIYTKNWIFQRFRFRYLKLFFHNNQKTRLICGILLILFLIPLYLSKKSFYDKIYYSALFMMIFSPVFTHGTLPGLLS